MSSPDLGMMEPSPFDPDAPSVPKPRPSDPARPMSQRELDLWLSMPAETRVYDAYRCMFNIMAEDGVGLGSGTFKQCKTRIFDPTRGRYCLDHSQSLDLEYYSPEDYSEISAGEASANLTRIVPKAVKTLELVMDDEDAPPGIRAKAADSVLDRTGFAKGVDVRMDAKVAVVDITSIIKERLDSLRDAKITEAGLTPSTPSGTTIVHEPPDPEPATGTATGKPSPGELTATRTPTLHVPAAGARPADPADPAADSPVE